MMEYKAAQNMMTILARRVRYLVILSLALILCNLLLSLLLWHQSNNRQVVLVPMGLHKQAVVGNGQVSASYLEQIALFFVYERLNITPKSVSASDDLILTYTDPAYYSRFKQGLIKEAKLIQDRKVSSTFYVRATMANVDNLTVVVEGTLKRWVGERMIGTSHKRYQLNFQQIGSELLLASFQEIQSKDAG